MKLYNHYDVFLVVEEVAGDADGGDGGDGDSDGDVGNLAATPARLCVRVYYIDCIYYITIPSFLHKMLATCYLPIAGDLEGI